MKRSVGGFGSCSDGAYTGYEVVVMASCKSAHERLQIRNGGQQSKERASKGRIAYKEAYIPATQISNCMSPGCSEDELAEAEGAFTPPFATACFSTLPLTGFAMGSGASGSSSMTPEDGTLCSGAACFRRAIGRSGSFAALFEAGRNSKGK